MAAPGRCWWAAVGHRKPSEARSRRPVAPRRLLVAACSHPSTHRTTLGQPRPPPGGRDHRPEGVALPSRREPEALGVARRVLGWLQAATGSLRGATGRRDRPHEGFRWPTAAHQHRPGAARPGAGGCRGPTWPGRRAYRGTQAVAAGPEQPRGPGLVPRWARCAPLGHALQPSSHRYAGLGAAGLAPGSASGRPRSRSPRPRRPGLLPVPQAQGRPGRRAGACGYGAATGPG